MARSWRSAGLEGTPTGLNAAAFSPDGVLVLTGGQDGTVRLWEMATGKEIRRYEGHTRRVVAVAFSPDGHWVLHGSSDETARRGSSNRQRSRPLEGPTKRSAASPTPRTASKC